MIAAQSLAFLLLVPFVGIFAYAGWHEYRRYKADGKNSYGLTYDPETNTTHVGAIAEDAESFDPEEFDPELTDAANTAEQNKAETEDTRHSEKEPRQ